MKSVKTYRTLPIALVTVLCLPGLAQAKGMDTPFQACKGITILEDPTGQKVLCDSCAERAMAQFAPASGVFKSGFNEAVFAGGAKGFLSQVADETASTLDQSIAELKRLKSCVQGEGGRGCPQAISRLTSNLDLYSRELQKSMLLVHADGQGSERINSSMMPMDGYTPNPLAGISPSRAMVSEAQAMIDDLSAIGRHKCDVRQQEVNAKLRSRVTAASMPKINCNDVVHQELQMLAERSQEQVRGILYGAMPVLSMIKGARVSGAHYVFDQKSISSALDGLISNAQKEKSLARKAQAQQQLEFGAFNLERFRKNTLKGERDLMDYIAFSPMVEAVLKKNPKYCGLATGLARRADIRSMQYSLGTGALMLTGFFTAGAGFDLAGAAALGTQVIGLGGTVSGMGFVGANIAEFQRAKTQVLTGVDPEKQIQDRKKIDEAESSLRISLGLHPLDYIGSGVGGRALGRALAKNSLGAVTFLKADKAALKGAARIADNFLRSLFDGRFTDGTLAAMAKSSKLLKQKLTTVISENGFNPLESQQLALCFAGSPRSGRACRSMEHVFLREAGEEGSEGASRAAGETSLSDTAGLVDGGQAKPSTYGRNGALASAEKAKNIFKHQETPAYRKFLNTIFEKTRNQLRVLQNHPYPIIAMDDGTPASAEFLAQDAFGVLRDDQKALMNADAIKADLQQTLASVKRYQADGDQLVNDCATREAQIYALEEWLTKSPNERNFAVEIPNVKMENGALKVDYETTVFPDATAVRIQINQLKRELKAKSGDMLIKLNEGEERAYNQVINVKRLETFRNELIKQQDKNRALAKVRPEVAKEMPDDLKAAVEEINGLYEPGSPNKLKAEYRPPNWANDRLKFFQMTAEVKSLFLKAFPKKAEEIQRNGLVKFIQSINKDELPPALRKVADAAGLFSQSYWWTRLGATGLMAGTPAGYYTFFYAPSATKESCASQVNEDDFLTCTAKYLKQKFAGKYSLMTLSMLDVINPEGTFNDSGIIGEIKDIKQRRYKYMKYLAKGAEIDDATRLTIQRTGGGFDQLRTELLDTKTKDDLSAKIISPDGYFAQKYESYFKIVRKELEEITKEDYGSQKQIELLNKIRRNAPTLTDELESLLSERDRLTTFGQNYGGSYYGGGNGGYWGGNNNNNTNSGTNPGTNGTRNNGESQNNDGTIPPNGGSYQNGGNGPGTNHPGNNSRRNRLPYDDGWNPQFQMNSVVPDGVDVPDPAQNNGTRQKTNLPLHGRINKDGTITPAKEK